VVWIIGVLPFLEKKEDTRTRSFGPAELDVIPSKVPEKTADRVEGPGKKGERALVNYSSRRERVSFVQLGAR